MTSPHAPNPDEDRSRPRPTLEQIEAAAHAAAEERDLDALRRQVEATPRQDRPSPTPTDWEAVVLSIRDRTRPARTKKERERAARQARLDADRRRRVILATLDRLDRRFGRYVDAVVDHPLIARWVLDTISGARDGLVIRGAVGVGKTHAAVAAYRAVVAGGILPAVAVSAPALLDGLRPGREPVEELHACEEARLLLLDDLAAERVTDWTSETLYRLIDARYSRRLPTIITTNATGDRIREGLGERVASRLNGLGKIVTLEGPDRRTPAGD
jgi:DNA replication protein DnaC